MSSIYGEQHRALQEAFDTRRLADRLEASIVRPEIPRDHKGFVESRDMFFLASVDHRGYPTCSYKGGTPGFVKVIDPRTIAFPIYNGNGMFLSTGNILTTAKVGMLFIDFETPHRVRVQGTASIDRADPLVAEFPRAELVVRVAVSEVFINCPRYIHKYRRVQTSKYAPQAGREAPPPPQWKRIDAMQDVLPERERDVAGKLGGIITIAEYETLVRKGEG
ncbi:MAG TPA: pyridoxamine 5'-phosphate oxidase family protein [Candidatus Binataceae bacterium]|nr:pyridoxamine 5'-phosphate oxidase family protein [Candidatus Binataceae bacterium]